MPARVMVVVVVAGVAGCTVRSGDGSIPLPAWDGGTDDAPSAPVPTHECDPERLEDDPWNCGECDARCHVDDADRCVHGLCRCGASAPCTAGSDCRFGRCVASDPEGRVCEFDPECGAGFGCIEAHCSRIECVPEVCDGIDNDCDGTVDGDASGPMVRWCTSAPPGAPLLAPCMRGFQVCEGGAWGTCVGEVAPAPEQGLLGCDGEDNDCDGCVDGVIAEDGSCVTAVPDAFDVLFAIDTSGSMGEEIEAVKSAVRDFSSTYSASAAFRFAIALVPGRSDGVPTLLLDLSDFPTFAAALMGVSTLGGGGQEPTWDVVYEAANGELGVAWRDGSTRIIILLTDEEGQTYRRTRGLAPVDETMMCDALTHGEVFAAVADPSYYGGFDDCGMTFRISTDAAAMAADLATIIADPCG